MIITQFVLFVALWLLLKKEESGIQMSPAMNIYVQTFDILITLALIFIMAKWFKMRLIRRIVLGNTTEIALALQKMIVLRISIWEFLVLSNTILWVLFNMQNALYLLAILAVFTVFILPTDSAIRHNIEELQN